MTLEHQWNRQTIVLVGLTVLIQFGAIAISTAMPATPSLPGGETHAAVAGAGLAVVWVIEALLLVGLVAAYAVLRKHIPFWVVEAALYVLLAVAIAAGVLSSGGAYLSTLVLLAMVAGIVLAVLVVLSRHDLYWLAFDAAAITIAAGVAAYLGTLLTPLALLGLFAVMVLWDEIAVNHTNLMERLVTGLASPYFPVAIVVPLSWRLDLHALFDGELGGGDTAVIGVGDFAIPGALAVSAAGAIGLWAGALVTLGSAVGMILLHGRVLHTERAHPGLPNLCGGAAAGLFAAVLVVIVA